MSLHHHHLSHSKHRTAIPQISPPNTKTRTRRPAHSFPNITDIDSFNRLMRLRDDRLQEYLDYPRRNYRRLDHGVRQLVLPSDSMCLHPCNAEARIEFARIALNAVNRFDIASRAPFTWVTISPARFTVPIAEAHEFNLKPPIASVREGFGDIPFLAMVEAGHYRWSPLFGAPRSDRVSFHVHLITWERSRAEVANALRPFGDKHRNMVGGRSYWIRSIGPQELELKMLYKLKGQVKSYRYIRKPDFDTDWETGEVLPMFRHSKDWMRTGDHVKMIEVFGYTRLDNLIFGNGLGTQIARLIRYQAMLPFCSWAARQNAINEEEGRSPTFPFVAGYRALGFMLRRDLGDDVTGA